LHWYNVSMKHNKLVRDKIPDIIRERGENVITHVTTGKEYREKLREKLLEEVHEFLRDDNIEEVADILEVLEAIVWDKAQEWDEVLQVKTRKHKQRGGFTQRIVLDEA